ncbi:MAG: aminotransferase class I/II-fold pyridoxal phosphate-dependent enzyme [Candidatus Krumholzibacteria bacterium]|nr:aminotransferase class I/II-fold pyridoxal phosphate-dependent enzyme [Candidatus Krumholzibacteria bacterium]
MGRLDKLPPYLFSAIDAAKEKARAAGVSVVDLGVGDPDRPTPRALVEVMARAVADPACHCYPAQRGDAGLKQAIALWLASRHGVHVDPARQVLVLVGSKEGLGHLPLTCVEEGDNVLVPDLGYPVYGQATILAGGEPRAFKLKSEMGFLPDLDELARLMDNRTRLLFLNYPNNPTGAVAGQAFWQQVVELCGERNVILVNDAAYLEVTLDGSRPASLLRAADPAADRVVELHSLSKMFNMTGWRIAFAAGHPDVVGDLARVKESIDSGVFTAIQATAAHALGESFTDLLDSVMCAYPERRRIMVDALTSAGFEVFDAAATFYVWCRVPGNESSVDFCGRALEDIGVVVTPGPGFGPGGEGWFRISLTASDEDVAEGARRIGAWK